MAKKNSVAPSSPSVADKRVGIIYRKDKPEVFRAAKVLAEWLIQGKAIVFHQNGQEKPVAKSQSLRSEKQVDQLDLVVVLGGDGTYLTAVHIIKGRPIPILGINMGSLGFLTNTRSEDLYKAVVQTLDGRMSLRPRAMFHIQVNDNKGKIQNFIALNDVVVERGELSQLISMNLYYQGSQVCELKADGLIIATPTGSTAYNLAAGGPILHPEVEAMVVTPVSPHSLTSRPLVFSDKGSISIQLANPRHRALLTIDGQQQMHLEHHHQLTISKHERYHFVVRPSHHNYFNLLREKLKFGQRD